MKKLVLLSFCLISSLLFSSINAQQYRDVVTLKNGSIVKGLITEQVPSGNLKIETADGSLFVYPMTDVERITKEEITPPEDVSKIINSQMMQQSNPVYGARRLEPALSFLFSFLISGTGQMYNGQVGRGIGMLLGTYGLMGIGVGMTYGTETASLGAIMILGSIGVYFWSFIDAPIFASKMNRLNGFAIGKNMRLNIYPEINYGPKIANTWNTTNRANYGMKFNLSF